jgi:large subunit ribosomal protein L25
VLSIALGSQVLPAMVQRIERHPIRPEILHVDLQRVDLLEPVTAEVAVALVGESPAERSRVGIILRQTETLLIRGLPQELPRVLEADLATLLEVGDRILAKDLALPPGVELLADPELLLASVARPAAEEIFEAVEAEAPATAAEERREETERGTP